ncbi:MAG TPA: IS21 family transposase [Flavitalea sp.]|nr:IS21 family transposase [Flavitalea sp.]
MNMIRSVLEMHQQQKAIKEIARVLGLSRNTVRKYIREYFGALDEGTIPDIALGSNKQIADVVFTKEQSQYNSDRHITLIEHFNKERKHLFKRRGNKLIIWEEYRDANLDSYSYSQYCLLLRQYVKKADISMVLHYDPAEVIEIDFAGDGLSYVARDTGEIIKCQVFIAVMPFSGMVFCIAVHNQQTAAVIYCINEMLGYIGGLPTGYIICDNMKTLVNKASKTEPVLTDACNQLSDHYGTIFSATRPFSPRDKPNVERGVAIAYGRIYTPLRHKLFTSLEELNEAIAVQLELLNDRNFRESAFSRRQLFTAHEMPLLRPLPISPFSPKEFRKGIVGKNYHIELNEPDKQKYYYSVPWQHVGREVKIYYDSQVVEVYLNDFSFERIAVHKRDFHKKYTTDNAHMSEEHLATHKTKGWNNEYFYALADQIGPATRAVIEKIISRQPNRTQGYRTCMSLLSLNRKDGTKGRLEAACERISIVPRPSFHMVQNILLKNLDKAPGYGSNMDLFTPVEHENIRGRDAYK